ncbi:unnamed protein product [Microthlaspi erraticum]|uniref:NYN domain-containing protein n=1 Tax=Microthlaspi erraticum TaxID=1685480 RepID=A0A6D2IS38_9BRAS|nr:unnamed protein product [Microthlaspi erraticum]CAA7032550.1 unnamed protein product [Microthlaspi erraticum]
MWGQKYAAAKPEYAAAQIAVWWDMNDCPIPEGYDPHWVRPSIEAAFKKLGYVGPVSITAYANQRQTPKSPPASALLHWNRCCAYQNRKYMRSHVLRYARMASSQSASGNNDAHIQSGGRCLLLGSGQATTRDHVQPLPGLFI